MAFCTNCGATVNGAFCTQCGKPLSAGAGSAPPPPQGPPPQYQPAAAPPPQAPPYQAAPPYPAAGPYQPAPAQPGPGFAVQRRTSPIVWVLVIIFGLFVLGGLAVVGTTFFVVHKVKQAGLDPELMQRNPGLAITKMLATINPDVEVLNTDDGAGTITVRDRKTGKVTTMSFDDARNGRFHFTATDENGKTASMEFGGSASKLPDWIPAYPGSTPQVAFTASGNDGSGGTFSFSTGDSAAKVQQFYQDKMKEMGMKITNVLTTDTGGMVNGTDDSGGRTLNAIISTEQGQTKVAVTFGKK